MIPEKVERVARFLRERLRDCGAEVPDQRDMERVVAALCEQPWAVLAVGEAIQWPTVTNTSASGTPPKGRG